MAHFMAMTRLSCGVARPAPALTGTSDVLDVALLPLVSDATCAWTDASGSQRMPILAVAPAWPVAGEPDTTPFRRKIADGLSLLSLHSHHGRRARNEEAEALADVAHDATILSRLTCQGASNPGGLPTESARWQHSHRETALQALSRVISDTLRRTNKAQAHLRLSETARCGYEEAR